MMIKFPVLVMSHERHATNTFPSDTVASGAAPKFGGCHLPRGASSGRDRAENLAPLSPIDPFVATLFIDSSFTLTAP